MMRKLKHTLFRFRLFCWTVMIAASSLLVGCNDEFSKNPSNYPSLSYHYLAPSNHTFSLGSEASTGTMQINCEDAEWMIHHSATWLTVSPTHGKESAQVTFTAEPHLSGDTARVAIVTLESAIPDWPYSRALSISQAAATPYLVLTETTHAFTGSAGSKDFEISSNSKWTASSDCVWVKPTKVSESLLTVSVEGNPTDDYRTATVFVSNKSGKQSIEITQSPAEVSVSQTTIQTEKDAVAFALSIESEIPWNAKASAEWILLTPSQGNAGTTELQIALTENSTIEDRRGYVCIYSSDYEKVQIEIIQKGLYVQFSEPELALSSDAEPQSITIESNTRWMIAESPEWLSLSATEGDSTQTVTVTPTLNNSMTPRSGYLIVNHPEVMLSDSLLVTQSGKKFDLDKKSLEFGVKGGTQPINVTSEYAWESTITGDWISTDISKGEGDAVVQVTATETMLYEERFGSIKYSIESKDITVDVHQLAKYFTIEDKSFEFTSKGGVSTLSFSSNETWNIQLPDSVDWILLSGREGDGNGNITITVPDNASPTAREASMQINTSVGQNLQILIKQAGRYLSSNLESLSYFAAGGSQVMTIHTDGEYQVESSADWIRVEQDETSGWKIAVLYNETPIIREGAVTVQLTDLESGELMLTIPVKQTYEGGIYVDKAFEKEVNWDVSQKDGFVITVKSFSGDSSWDSKKGNTITFGKTDYPTDSSLDASKKDTINLNKPDYGNENNWN